MKRRHLFGLLGASALSGAAAATVAIEAAKSAVHRTPRVGKNATMFMGFDCRSDNEFAAETAKDWEDISLHYFQVAREIEKEKTWHWYEGCGWSKERAIEEIRANHADYIWIEARAQKAAEIALKLSVV